MKHTVPYGEGEENVFAVILLCFCTHWWWPGWKYQALECEMCNRECITQDFCHPLQVT